MNEIDEPLEETFRGRCTPTQKRIWEEAARLERRNLSDWIRITLDDVAEKRVAKARKRKNK